MGLLGKYATFKWLSQGGGGGGLGPFGPILLFFMAFFLIIFALQAAVSFIYEMIRSVLMFAPNFSTVLVGYALTVLILLFISANTPEEASEYLSASRFLTKSATAISVIVGYGLALEFNVATPPGEDGSSLLVAVLFLTAFCYCVYALYRSMKLIGTLDRSSFYQLAILFPVIATGIFSGFSIPVFYLVEGLLSIGFVVALPASLAIIQYRVKPQLPATTDTESAS